MNLLDRLLGRAPAPATIQPNTLRGPQPRVSPSRPADADAAALERYRYLVRTAPPEDLERAHAEAFARLTPEQRELARQDLVASVPPAEAPASSDPAALARSATRAELREPGTLERSFGASPAGPGVAGSFMNTFAAVFIGTTVAQALFGGFGDPFAEPMGDPGAAGTDSAALDGQPADVGFEGDPGGGGFGDFGGGDFGDFGGFDI